MRRKAHELPTADRVRELLEYDAQTGFLAWRTRPGNDPRTKTWNTKWAGKRINSLRGDGYLGVRIDWRSYLVHRVIWLIQTGSWPEAGLEIDHADGNRSNNVFSNLRLATRTQQQSNTKLRSNNLLGKKGVSFHQLSGRYFARIQVNGRTHSLGYFVTPEEAHRAYYEAAKKYHGPFARAA
jgi:hypothetical protein